MTAKRKTEDGRQPESELGFELEYLSKSPSKGHSWAFLPLAKQSLLTERVGALG